MNVYHLFFLIWTKMSTEIVTVYLDFTEDLIKSWFVSYILIIP